MNDVRLKQWASSIGPKACEVIERIFNSVTIKEQGYNSILSVLKTGQDLFQRAPRNRLRNCPAQYADTTLQTS